MSHNHQFVQFAEVKERYVKTVPHRVTGMRLDPNNPAMQVDWMLVTPEENFDFDVKAPKNFTYEDEVLELYSEQEVRLFKRLNRKLIEDGTLKLYTGEREEIDLSNMLTDEEIDEVAGIRQLPALKKRLASITAVVSLGRIRRAAEDLNRPVSIVNAINERINELTESTEDTK